MCFDATEIDYWRFAMDIVFFLESGCDFRFGRHFFHRIVGSAATTLKGTSAWSLRDCRRSRLPLRDSLSCNLLGLPIPRVEDLHEARERAKIYGPPHSAILIFDGELACLNLFASLWGLLPAPREIRVRFLQARM